MNVKCKRCKADVTVLPDGKLVRHLVGPAVTLDPSPTQFCDWSGHQFIPLSKLSGVCKICGADVKIDIQGEVEKHYPSPHSTLSAEDYCGIPERNFGVTHPKDPNGFKYKPGHRAEFDR